VWSNRGEVELAFSQTSRAGAAKFSDAQLSPANLVSLQTLAQAKEFYRLRLVPTDDATASGGPLVSAAIPVQCMHTRTHTHTHTHSHSHNLTLSTINSVPYAHTYTHTHINAQTHTHSHTHTHTHAGLLLSCLQISGALHLPSGCLRYIHIQIHIHINILTYTVCRAFINLGV
jgi:hypothetical protein